MRISQPVERPQYDQADRIRMSDIDRRARFNVPEHVSTPFYIAIVSGVASGSVVLMVGLASQWRFLDALMASGIVSTITFAGVWYWVLTGKRSLLRIFEDATGLDIDGIPNELQQDDEEDTEEVPALKSINDAIQTINVNGSPRHYVLVRDDKTEIDPRITVVLRSFIDTVWLSKVDARRKTWVTRGLRRDDWEACSHALEGWALVGGMPVMDYQKVISALVKKGIFPPL